MLDPYLSIVVPAFNEEERLGRSLEAIAAFGRDFRLPVEVLVVDDGSRDATARIAAEELDRSARDGGPPGRLLRHEPNRGKGFSIREGVLAARGKVVLVTDADLSTPLDQTEPLLRELERMGRGIVIGSRALEDSTVRVHQNRVRELMGKTFNKVVRLLTGLPFRDTQCGFKVMYRDDVAPIFRRARVDGFSYDVELLYVAVRRGLPVRELPVVWSAARGSKVGLLSDPLRMLRDVWRVRRWHGQGAYDEA